MAEATLQERGKMFDHARRILWPDRAPHEGADSAEEIHFVNGRGLRPPFPEHCAQAVFGMGCFWGAERLFWSLSGVWVTAVGYSGGTTPNPTYRDVCSGMTGHAEVVLIAYDPDALTYAEVLRVFWEGHDPTQLNRQGNDIGTQYRSVIFAWDSAQRIAAESTRMSYDSALAAAGRGRIVTEIRDWADFHYAESYHQQYLAKNPGGYCGLGGTGVACAVSAVPVEQ